MGYVEKKVQKNFKNKEYSGVIKNSFIFVKNIIKMAELRFSALREVFNRNLLKLLPHQKSYPNITEKMFLIFLKWNATFPKRLTR